MSRRKQRWEAGAAATLLLCLLGATLLGLRQAAAECFFETDWRAWEIAWAQERSITMHGDEEPGYVHVTGRRYAAGPLILVRPARCLMDEDLTSAHLAGAALWGADLRDAVLRHADLRHADLRRADLYGADLRGADLRGADFSGAMLRDANLDTADLRGAELSGVVLAGAIHVRGARWPAGFSPRALRKLERGQNDDKADH